ncbi:MAG TPA: magnesium/cobalt transporter CorA [Candidatus Dormibacteraeota bacterium]|jgi:magnesium transporter|nr:magnesium/cobalt transporter CorA [Candidatus Dormibacteraeota bacterium]
MRTVIVDCAVYQGGRRTATPGSPAEAWRLHTDDPDSFIWIGIVDPSDEELAEVQRAFSIHELAAEDMVAAHQRPKLEVYDDNLLLVLKPARYLDEQEEIVLDELQILAGSGFLLTVRHGDRSALGRVRHRLEQAPATLALGPFAALHAIVDRIVDDYAPIVDGVEKDIREVEERVFSDSREKPTERIYRLKRQVLAFQQATAPLLDPLDRLSRRRYRRVPEDLDEYFRDVHDHLVRIVERILGDRELLTNVLQANLAQISVQQNDDMRKISAWVGLLGVPTVIGGVYGMNFVNMPELHWQFGYFYALGLMVACCLGLFLLFRRTGWL